MLVIGLSPVVGASPSREAEALSLRIVRGENRMLLHLVAWVATSVFLVVLNLLISGAENLWSLYPVVVLGALFIAHAFFGGFLGRRVLEKSRRQLAEEWRGRSRRVAEDDSEISDLRKRLLETAEAARQALRPISPETAADISRGEAKALELVAWLDEVRALRPVAEGYELRRTVAMSLSKPGADDERVALERLLTQLDIQDVKLATLEREASRRKSLVESFLLVLDSAGAPGSSVEVLAAVSSPLRARVRLLEDALSADEVTAVGIEESGVEAERIREEVRLAQDLQKSILPSRAPEVPGLSVSHFFCPSSEVGGDFYDFYATRPQRLLVAVGDASGHGVDASMVSSMAKSALYTHVSAQRDLAETMAEMNRMMCDTVGRRRLMTLTLLELDVEEHRVSWVNAGHVFPLLARDGEVIEFEQSSYPLGVRKETSYSIVEQDFRPGDRILVLTDGCIEAVDPAGEVYGWERLNARFGSLAARDSKSTIEGLKEDLWSHLGGESPQDDVALVAIAFDPSPEGKA